MSVISAGQKIGRTLKNAGRLKTIVAVFAKHGFYNVAEKINLGRYVLERFSLSEDMDKYSLPERLRMSFEQLGPTFIKLGQLLATRPDLIPEEFVSEFQKLNDKVQALDFKVIEGVLKEELQEAYEKQILSVDPKPIGCASIAQVHRAQLKTGEHVVIKVQRPGIISTINEDLNVLYMLAELLYKYFPEVRPYNPQGIVDEYFRTLELETNFIIESNNIKRMAENFKDDDELVIPKVYDSLSSEKILVMQELAGSTLNDVDFKALTPELRNSIVKKGMQIYLQMVFKHGFFHGDLHAGNFILTQNHKIGLIDFGVVGRLNRRTKRSIANMLLFLSQEDYEALASEYLHLAPFNENTDIEQVAKGLREVISPFFGLTLKNINVGRILLKSTTLAAKNHLVLPTELMLFFKSLVGIESLGRRVEPDFEFLGQAMEFANELVQTKTEPQSLLADLNQWSRDSSHLINDFPRQVHSFIRRVNSPLHSFKLSLPELKFIRGTLANGFFLIFVGLLAASLVVGAALMMSTALTNHEPSVPAASIVFLSLAAILVGYALWLKGS